MSDTAAPSTALTVKEKSTLVRTFIEQNLGEVQKALPNVGITPTMLARTAFTAMYNNPTLYECDKGSLMRCLVQAAELGLTFSLGRAYMVPFRSAA